MLGGLNSPAALHSPQSEKEHEEGHQFEGFLARLLAHFFEQGDVAAHERLERCADGSENAARADGDAADEADGS